MQRERPVGEWKKHATNLVTGDEILIARIDDRNFLYRIDGKNKSFTDFRPAFLSGMPYGNAEKHIIILHAHWKTAQAQPLFLYTPGGVLISKHKSFESLKKMAKTVESRFPPASAEEAEERKRLYLRNIEKKHEAKRRAMIDREKQKILAAREREIHLKKIEEKYGDSMGSW